MPKHYRRFPMLYFGIENHFLCKNEHNQSVSPNNTRMKKTINDITYYIPNNLTQEQEAIYTHIIDWKRKNITTERGFYGNHEYDSIFPEKTKHPAMMYEPIKTAWDEMQDGKRFAYKLHQFAHHAVSSQTACINLFTPLLLSDKANHILPRIPGSPSDFKEIAEDHHVQPVHQKISGFDRQRPHVRFLYQLPVPPAQKSIADSCQKDT